MREDRIRMKIKRYYPKNIKKKFSMLVIHLHLCKADFRFLCARFISGDKELVLERAFLFASKVGTAWFKKPRRSNLIFLRPDAFGWEFSRKTALKSVRSFDNQENPIMLNCVMAQR